MLCILTSKWMLVHVFAWLKTMKNTQKSSQKYLSILRMRGSRNAHIAKQMHVVTLLRANEVGFDFSMNISKSFISFLHKIGTENNAPLNAYLKVHILLGGSLFCTMQTHPQACNCWSKYTTNSQAIFQQQTQSRLLPFIILSFY